MKKNTISRVRNILILIILTSFSTNSFSQVFWTEDFGTGSCANQGQLASAYSGVNGTWSVTVTGVEGVTPNLWYVSTTEAGMGVGNCGDGCLSGTGGGLTNQTLHIGSDPTVSLGDIGAAYDVGGLCFIGDCPQADKRAETPIINASGQVNITLNFNYMMGGQSGADFGTVEYSTNGGATWSVLPTAPAVTSTCAGGQGLWTVFPATVLPAACNNCATLKLGFRWINDDDGLGTDPSFAVDDITLSVISNAITTGIVPAGSHCACSTFNVPFTSSGTFLAGNIYTAELSDATGSFAAPVSIGTLASTANTGSIACTIPCTTLAGTLYRIRVTSSNPVCIGTPNTINITINAAVTPSVTASASANPICSGALVTFFAGAINGGTTPTYQWQVNGVNVPGATSATFASSTIANNDVVTVNMVSNALCASPTTASSTPITMTVAPSVTPSVTIAAVPSGPICAGTSVTFTATPTNGGTTPTYQWSINGVPVVGATSSTFTSTTLLNGDNVTVTMTSNANCVSPTTATSAPIAIVVSTPAASVTIASSPTGTICTGTSVTFTATPTNGGATPTYQWSVNGVPVVGATSVTFTSTTLVNGDNVTCEMTSSLACATGSPATSNTITMSITGALVPSVTITAVPSGPICPGTSVTFTATPVNGGTTPTYQWLVNGVVVPGATSVTFTSTTLINGDAVTVVMTSSSPCAAPTTGTSPAITMVVTAPLPASVTIVGVPASPVCAGASVTFTATPTNGGPTPTYQWQVGGVNIPGATSSTFTTSTLIAGTSSVTVVMTSSATCVSGSPATSTALPYTVNPIPTVTVNSPTICSGATTTLTSGGATTYTWSAGATSTGVNTATASPTSTTTYTVTGTTGACSATAIATVTVSLCNRPNVYFTVSDSVFCNSGCVNFTDLSSNTPTSWSWSFPGGTPSTSTAQNPMNICYNVVGNYLVTLIATNATGSDTLTKFAYINVVNPIQVHITGNTNVNACEGTELTAQPNGQTYSWGALSSGINISCNTCQTATVSATETGGVYVYYTDIHGCPDTDTTTINVTAKYSYFMPTGFSPNHDGNNDVLYVKGRGVSSIDLRIFDRNGEKVFTSTDLDNGWDGTYLGLAMNNNVFVYTLEVVFCNGDVQKEHGSVTLVR